MDDAALAHEIEHLLLAGGASAAACRPRRARVHQRADLARQEAVVDEEVLLDVEPRIAPRQIAGAVAGDAVTQRQVLRPGRGANRVGLDEAEPRDRAWQRG